MNDKARYEFSDYPKMFVLDKGSDFYRVVHPRIAMVKDAVRAYEISQDSNQDC